MTTLVQGVITLLCLYRSTSAFYTLSSFTKHHKHAHKYTHPTGRQGQCTHDPPSTWFLPSSDGTSFFSSSSIQSQSCLVWKQLRASFDEIQVEKESGDQQEFDIDKIMSMTELNEVSRSLGAPLFPEDPTITLEMAKDRLWTYVENTAEKDIGKMCIGQLAGIVMELSGEEMKDETTLEEARDQVRSLIDV